MHSHRNTRSAVALAFVIVSSVWLAAATPKMAPNITLQSADGATAQLAAYRGQVVLVDFWASWCAPCKASFPALDAIYREYHARGVQVLAVNVDERRRDADAFLGAHPHALTVLFDQKGVSPSAFGVKGMPSSFVIDRAGTIRFAHMGYTGTVGEHYRRELDQLLGEHHEP